MKIKISLLFIIVFISAEAQVNLDSLAVLWENEQNPDSVRIEAILSISRYGYLFSQPDSAEYFARLGYDEAIKTGNQRWESEAAKIIGISYAIRGNHVIAIDYFNKSLKINEALNDQYGIAGSLNNIGLLYKETGDLDHALEYLLKSYDMYLDQDNLNGKALCSGNIGMIYDKLGSPEKGLTYAKLSLGFYEELGQPKGIANSLSSMGTSYASLADFEADFPSPIELALLPLRSSFSLLLRSFSFSFSFSRFLPHSRAIFSRSASLIGSTKCFHNKQPPISGHFTHSPDSLSFTKRSP